MGEHPVAVVQPRYEWLYLAGFVHPQSGRTSWYLLPRIDQAIFRAVLHAFAEEQVVDEEERILLILNGAGCRSLQTKEVQPAEHLWELTDALLVNRCFESIEEMEEVLAIRCCELVEQTEHILSRTVFAGWPLSPTSATVCPDSVLRLMVQGGVQVC